MDTKYLLTAAYDGTNFHGYQVQNGNDLRTVQKVLQDTCEALYGKRLPIVGCSRTDAGVHARDFKFTFVTDDTCPGIPPEKLPAAWNSLLPDDIAIRNAVCVPMTFHVRHDVYEKEYEYIIKNTEIRDPFTVSHAYHVRTPLDAEKLNLGAQAFLGTHDFRGFMASGSDIADTVRTVRRVSVRRKGDRVVFAISADGFLYNMVRIFVGTMLACAEGKIRYEELPGIIASGERKRAGKTVPPQGLYLNKVVFTEHAFYENGKEDPAV